MLPKQTRENHINMYMRWYLLLEAIATYLFKRKKPMEQQGKHDNHPSNQSYANAQNMIKKHSYDMNKYMEQPLTNILMSIE